VAVGARSPDAVARVVTAGIFAPVAGVAAVNHVLGDVAAARKTLCNEPITAPSRRAIIAHRARAGGPCPNRRAVNLSPDCQCIERAESLPITQLVFLGRINSAEADFDTFGCAFLAAASVPADKLVIATEAKAVPIYHAPDRARECRCSTRDRERCQSQQGRFDPHADARLWGALLQGKDLACGELRDRTSSHKRCRESQAVRPRKVDDPQAGGGGNALARFE
jgi:hypothetical protein